MLIGPSLGPVLMASLNLVTHAWHFSTLVEKRSLTCLLVISMALDHSMEGSLQLYYPVSLALRACSCSLPTALWLRPPRPPDCR